jgi:hypothetical protein
MLEMLRDLVQHNGDANAALLGAIRQSDAAVSDDELRELLIMSCSRTGSG